jgi:hypothetical protein
LYARVYPQWVTIWKRANYFALLRFTIVSNNSDAKILLFCENQKLSISLRILLKKKAMKRINRLKVVLVEQNKTGKWLAGCEYKRFTRFN